MYVTCYVYDHTRPLHCLQIDGSHLGGSDVSSSVATLVNGYALLRPLPGDTLRTNHSLPQVRSRDSVVNSRRWMSGHHARCLTAFTHVHTHTNTNTQSRDDNHRDDVAYNVFQVVVYVNDVPTSCADGANCSFTWRTEFTPVITGVSPTLGDTILM